MRLLNTSTLHFGEFSDHEIPIYLILSHRWGKDEVSYQQMASDDSLHGEGFVKIDRFCQIAARKGFKWVWVDTCCIDKKSSAELSEAINSMYQWYHNAQECLIYLSDVEEGNDAESIQDSAWFTRGWTVQELLAPRLATFYDKHWTELGTRIDLLFDVVVAARIDTASLEEGLWSERSVARKMSWFAHRQTSRIEDLAYCMLGIFDINMPLIYGEGLKAFKRLQIEIINSSDDESIFAWDPHQWPRPKGYVFYGTSMLAPHPKCFEGCGSVKKHYHSSIAKRPPYVATNKSLQISVLPRDMSQSPDTISALTGQNVFTHPVTQNADFSLLRLTCCAEDDRPYFIVLVRPYLFKIEDMVANNIHSGLKLRDWIKFKAGPFKAHSSFNMLEGQSTQESFQTMYLPV